MGTHHLWPTSGGQSGHLHQADHHLIVQTLCILPGFSDGAPRGFHNKSITYDGELCRAQIDAGAWLGSNNGLSLGKAFSVSISGYHLTIKPH